MRRPRKPKEPPRIVLTLIFAIVVFIIMTITMSIVGGILVLLTQVGIVNFNVDHDILTPTLSFGIASILIGTIVATIISSIPLRPVNKIINGMNKLAEGDYKTRIDLGHPSFAKEISNSFNTLASELGKTEMLRSDFINNFSHEFKTPIVSICGFAKLLQKESLSEERQKEYLGIIIDESTRLSDLATNVLNLTKVENQSILTDITFFNLSEQIRNCILMLENKWAKKNIAIVADFNEHTIDACEELLKQVWINLIDNAIKFTPMNGEIDVSIVKVESTVEILIKNNGPMMSQEEVTRVFDKFWQGDTSHASEGTGIGLSIAKRIVDLHNGTISVSSTQENTIFTVALPIKYS